MSNPIAEALAKKQDEKLEEIQDPAAEAPAAKKAKAGSYKNVRNKRIFRANGSELKAVNGYFEPSTAEEKELCKHFESVGILEAVK